MSLSAFDRTIPGEIVPGDGFFERIVKLASTEPLGNILEIGSSSGLGSTQAWIKGLSARGDRGCILWCLEATPARYEALIQNVGHHVFVRCVHGLSISDEELPAERHLGSPWMGNTNRAAALEDLRTGKEWLRQHPEIPRNMIQQIKRNNGISEFGAVLIDGGELSGPADFAHVYGATWLLLDDIQTYKNYSTHDYLKHDKNYVLMDSNPLCRNGWAIWRHV